MKEEEILALLRLQKTTSVGNILAKKLITTVGNAPDIFKQKKSTLLKIHGIGTHVIQNLLDHSYQELAEKELNYLNDNNVEYSCFFEKEYPKNLQHCIDAPILIFKEGAIDFSNKKIISVVGTRMMTNYGRDFCQRFVDELAVYNPIIISGFAYGVDICAHRAAMKSKLQTIAVLGHGFGQIYPKVHKKYIHQVNENGGFITEFFHNQPPLPENFLKRNRIIAGLSEATIVVESALKGGSLVTADLANSYDRDVFAVPGRVNDRMSQGCNQLIYNNKAHLLKSSEDLVKMLNWDLSEKPQPVQSLFNELPHEEQKIVACLKGQKHQSLDLIAAETQIPIDQLTTLLLQLELKNKVVPLPGKLFKLS